MVHAADTADREEAAAAPEAEGERIGVELVVRCELVEQRA